MILATSTLLLILLGTQAAPPTTVHAGTETVCDFSDRKPLHLHDALGPAVQKIHPKYPQMARDARVAGKVVVVILVDREGLVREACVASGHPLLRDAARIAATKWKFNENFGFGTRQRPGLLQASIVFQFVLGVAPTAELLDPSPPN